MPFGPHSTARLLVIASTADFAIADGTVKARPVMVEVERMLRTTPLCLRSIQRLPAPSVQYIVPCSVGLRMASAARNGAHVTVLTVFACDPQSSAPAEWWDRAGGFRTLGEAACARREEDRRGKHPRGAAVADLRRREADHRAAER